MPKISKVKARKVRVGGINVNRMMKRTMRGMNKGMGGDLIKKPKGFGPQHLGLKRAKY